MTSTARPATNLSPTTSKAERMLATADKLGIAQHLAQVHHRLTLHEHERLWTPPSPRRTELDAMIASDMDVLCEAFLVLDRAAVQAEG